MEDDTDLKNSLELAIKKAEKPDFIGTKEMMDKLMDRKVFTLESVEAAHKWATIISKAWYRWPLDKNLREALITGYSILEDEFDDEFISRNSDSATDLKEKLGIKKSELEKEQKDLQSKFTYKPGDIIEKSRS